MESSEDKKPNKRRTRFGSGLMTIKKSIRDSFSIFMKSNRERPSLQQNPILPAEEPQNLDFVAEKPPQGFTSVVERSLQSSHFAENNAGWDSELKIFKPEMKQTMSHPDDYQDRPECYHGPPDTGNIAQPYAVREYEKPSDYTTIPETVSSDAAREQLSLTEAIVYTEPLKDSIIPSKALNSLPLPVPEASVHSRRNSPVYETVAPAYPPKNYDQQKEHSGIVSNQMKTRLTQSEDNQLLSQDSAKSYANTPKMPYVDQRRLGNGFSESLYHAGDIHITDSHEEAKPEVSYTSPYSQSQIAVIRQDLGLMKDQATQTDFEVFDPKNGWISISGTGNEAKTNFVIYMDENQGANEIELIPVHFRQSSLVNSQVREDNYAVTSTKGKVFKYPDKLSKCEQYLHLEPMNNMVLRRDLIAASDTGKGSRALTKGDGINPSPIRSFKSSSNFLTPPVVERTRVSTDDARSMYSSEGAESDFVFYPSAPATIIEPGIPAAFSSARSTPSASHVRSYSCGCEDNFVLAHDNDSSRSDFCGSSLDELTRQFFLDDDVLSDDVFMEEAEQYSYPSWKYNNDPSPRTLHSIEEYCPNQTFQKTDCGRLRTSLDKSDSCVKERGTELYRANLQKRQRPGIRNDESLSEIGNSDSSAKTDEINAYKYDDIKEVLENFRELSASADTLRDQSVSSTEVSNHDRHYTSRIENQSHVKREDSHDKQDAILNQGYDIRNLTPRSSNNRSSSDNCEEIDSRFADMFDSLRKNSVQFKSRQMWKKRRSNRRQSLIAAQTRTLINVESRAGIQDPENHSDPPETQTAHLLVNPNDNMNRGNSSSLKPLRGILKKTALAQPISIAERNLCDLKRETTNAQCKNQLQRRRVKSLGLEIYPLERTEAMFGREILDMQYKVAKAHSPQSQVNAPFFNTIIDQAGNAYRKRRSQSLPVEPHMQHRSKTDFITQVTDCQARARYCYSSSKVKGPTSGHFQTPPADAHTKVPLSSVLTEEPAHLVNCAGTSKYTWYPKSNNVPDKEQENDYDKSITCPEPAKLNTQVQKTKSNNSWSPPAETRRREFITVRKNSLDVYRWNTCLHRRRKPQDKRVEKPGLNSNTVLLQRAISICPSERPIATL
ncbi:hypothetical protein ElyMa_003411000 [Elysia marginata]|uniref:Uncharacterized protein n=1 Tax=Elysia marginata TaxID=1093978 RepID=A0AAV4JTK9_9GAST|nr:hypothetical protein ElyMa_003411000 [Elysia marginata]